VGGPRRHRARQNEIVADLTSDKGGAFRVPNLVELPNWDLATCARPAPSSSSAQSLSAEADYRYPE
jgi:hypothetical protein